MFFIFLGLIVIVASTRLSIPGTSLAVSPYNQTFAATSDLNYTSGTTGGVTTASVHNRAHLTATDAWTPAMGLENGEQINDIMFASTDANYGWVVTQNTNIYRTNDGGTLWHKQNSGTTLPLRAVFFQDTSTGWIVGGSSDDTTGIVLKTTNGGGTWTDVTPAGAPTLYDVDFSNANNGWLVGASGSIYKTTSGSSTVAGNWTGQNVSGVTNELHAVYVDPNGTKGIIVGQGGAILLSSNSGGSWSARTPANPVETSVLPSINFSRVYFRSQSLGWIFGSNGLIVKTTDDGATALTIQSFGPTGNPGPENYINTFYPTALRTVQIMLRHGWFANDSIGIVVGDNGTILKTTDGGSTWTPQLSATSQSLRAATMTSTTTAYVAGGTSVLLKTTDGGSGSPTSWVSRTQGRLTNFNDVAFISSSDGIIVGASATILSTTNAGGAWKGIGNPMANDINGLGRIDANTYWIIGSDGSIYKTTNAGTAWSSQASGLSTSLNDIAAVDTNTAFIAGASGKILKTSNGSSWSQQTSGTSNDINAIYASPDAQYLLAVGNSGTITRSSDGGTTWSVSATSDITLLSTSDSILNYSLYDVLYATADIAYAVGSNGLIIKSSDRGQTWTQKTSGTTSNLNTLVRVSTNSVWVGGDTGTILSTTDSGATWSIQLTGVSRNILAFSAPLTTNFWIVGQTTFIGQSTNSGSSFNVVHNDSTKFIMDVEGSGSTIYGSGFNDTIVKSTDSGATWSAQTTGTGKDFNGIAVTDTLTAWAVGNTGTIVQTTNGGTWGTQTSGTGAILEDIDAASSSVLWAVGTGGTILKTTNGGGLWSTEASGTSNTLNVVDAIDTSTAVAVGGGGTILKTANGGGLWSAEASGTSNTLFGVSFANSSVGWAVGGGGTILKTANGGGLWSAQTAGLGNITIYRVTAVDSLTAFASSIDGYLLHTIDGGTTWTNTADKHGVTSTWANNFGSAVALGSGYGAVPYTPTYTSSARVVSTAIQSDTVNLVNKATLTATDTATNGQTITYYLLNNDAASSTCGDGSWKQVTSGSQYTFLANGPKLYWCATLSSNSSSTTPVISEVQITYSTTSGGRVGGGGDDNPTPCNTSDDCRIGYYCDIPTKQCLLSDTGPSNNPSAPRKQAGVPSTDRIEWKFFDTADNETGFRLCKQTCDLTKGGVRIDDKVITNLSSIFEGVITPLTPNTLYENRVVQSFNNAGISPETPLDSVRTLAEAPLTPTVITDGSSTILSITRGKNPGTTEFLIHRITGNSTQAYLAIDGSITNTPVWSAFNGWGAEVRNGNGVVDTERHITLTHLTANSQYLFEMKARTSDALVADRKETPFSPTVVVTTAIEQPTTIVGNTISSTPTSLTVWATASSFVVGGTFTNLGLDQSALWFENVTTGTNSGWTPERHWTSTTLTPDTSYKFRVKARNLVGRETPWSPVSTIRTHNAVPETPIVLKPFKGDEIPTTKIRVEGTAQTNLNVLIQIDNQGVKTTTPNASGDWALEITLAEGTHTLTAYSIDPATSLRSDEAKRSFSIKLPPPECTKDVWTCSSWNECSTGATQTRVCRRTTDCASAQTPKPQEIRSCTPPTPRIPIDILPPPPPPERRPIEIATPDVIVPPPTPLEPTPAPPTLRLDDPLPTPFTDTRVRDIFVNNDPVGTNVITAITPGTAGTVNIEGRLQASENVSVRIGSRSATTTTDEQGRFNATLDLSGYEGHRAFIETPAQSDLDLLKINDITINKAPVVAGSITSVTISGQKKSRRLIIRGRGEPGSVVTVIIESTPREVPVPVQSDGSWNTDVDVSDLEQGRHHVKLKTVSNSGESPIVQIAQFDVAAPVAEEVPPKPEPPQNPIAAAASAVSNAIGNGTQAVINEVKNGFPAVRRGATVVAQKTVEAAVVTHEAIVQIEPQTKATLAVALPTVIIVNPPLVAALPQIPFFIYHFVNWLLIILGIRKRRVPWGVVYDAITKQAIPLSIVRLSDSKTKKLVETQVSDRAGRFGFLVAPGNYNLGAVKAGYTSPSKLVTDLADGEYQPCYHQEVLPILNDHQSVSMAIPLDPVNANAPLQNNTFKHAMNRAGYWLRKANLPVMMIGLTFAVVMAANVPTLTNILLAIGYGFMTAFQHLLSPSEPKPWGTVFNAATLSAIPLALIDIIDTKYNKVLKTRLSDYQGRFTFLPPKGTYKLQARKTGFTFNPLAVKNSGKFRHPYKGDPIAIASDREAISVDIPLTPAAVTTTNLPESPKPTLPPVPSAPKIQPRQAPTPSLAPAPLAAAPANDPLLPILSPHLLNSPQPTKTTQPPPAPHA